MSKFKIKSIELDLNYTISLIEKYSTFLSDFESIELNLNKRQHEIDELHMLDFELTFQGEFSITGWLDDGFEDVEITNQNEIFQYVEDLKNS